MQLHVQAMEPDAGRPFPANGKIAARFGGKSAEALLELPAPSTKGGAVELAGVVWLTVGLLATDGFALQVPEQEYDHNNVICTLYTQCIVYNAL